LLRQAIENLRAEYGFEYSDDVFLDAVSSANSAEIARIPGKVFKAFCEGKISIDQYWSLLNITKTLIYPDIKAALDSVNAHITELNRASQLRLQAAGMPYPVSGFGLLGEEWNTPLLNALIVALTGNENVEHKKYDPEKNPRKIVELPYA